MKRFLLGSALMLLAAPAAAQTEVVTGGDLAGGLHDWRMVDVRSGGVSRVVAHPDPFGGAGVLEQVLPPAGSAVGEYRTELERFSPDTVLEPGRGLVPTAGGYGTLANLGDVFVSWYRDSRSTAGSWLGTAVRLYVFDPNLGVNGTSYIMIWEPVYNGLANNPQFAVPTDTWIHSEIDDDYFWRRPLYLDGQRVPRRFCGDNPSECFVFTNELHEWGFSPDAVIFGINVSAGPDWYGTYYGYVDHISLEILNGRTYHWDFEPGPKQAAVAQCEEDRRERRRARRQRRRARRHARR